MKQVLEKIKTYKIYNVHGTISLKMTTPSNLKVRHDVYWSNEVVIFERVRGRIVDKIDPDRRFRHEFIGNLL